MSESERLWAEIRALADRVAKLEADRVDLWRHVENIEKCARDSWTIGRPAPFGRKEHAHAAGTLSTSPTCMKCGKPRRECWCFADETPMTTSERLRAWTGNHSARSNGTIFVSEVSALEERLAQAERERDEWKRKATAVPMRELPSDIP